MKSDILLDAGTNELEVLVFRLAHGWFGVNVAKVREVIKPVEYTRGPAQHESVLGMINIRGQVMPVVDLALHLDLAHTEEGGERPEGRIIIMEFNGMQTGFLVDNVDQIHRMGWDAVRPSPDLDVARSSGDADHLASTTGTIEMGERLILMLDFESVADSILCEKSLHTGPINNPDEIDRGSKRVLLAEDSPFMRNLMTKTLTESGYTKLEVYPDGQSIWEAAKAGGEPIDAIISDIEMPRMDGLALTKLIKEDAELRSVPVVLFSSLVSEDNRKKGEQVGADVQIPKPELAEVVYLVDRAVTGRLQRDDHSHEPQAKAA